MKTTYTHIRNISWSILCLFCLYACSGEDARMEERLRKIQAADKAFVVQESTDEIDSIVGSDIRRAHNVAAQQEPAEAIDSIDPWEECSRKPAAHIFFGENKCFCQEEKKPTPKEIAKYVRVTY